MKLLFEFISFLNEAESDIKQLKKLNMGALYDRDPKAFNDLTIDERERLSSSGPKFSAATISAIEKMDDRQLPHRGRKQFVTWLANEIESYHDFHDEDARMIVDWINVVGIQQLHGLSFDEAMDKSYRWHYEQEQKQNAELSIKHRKEDIVASWPDGYAIVRAPSRDLKDEGSAMGHCVAGYEQLVNDGSSVIFSLRDAKGRPHTTIELDASTNKVIQIKGKANKPPSKQLYCEKIKEWLKTTKYDYQDCKDYTPLLSVDEARKLLRTTTKPLAMNFSKDVVDEITDDDLKRYVKNVENSLFYMEIDTKTTASSMLFERLIRILANSNDVSHRTEAAKNVAEADEDTTVEMTHTLASDTSPDVRLAVAQTIKRYVESGMYVDFVPILMKLCDDDDEKVAAAARPSIDKSMLKKMPNSGYYITASKIENDTDTSLNPYYIRDITRALSLSKNDTHDYPIIAAKAFRLSEFVFVRHKNDVAKVYIATEPRHNAFEILNAIQSGEIPTI